MKEKILQEIFSRKLLNESYRELSEAVLCGRKCSTLSPEEITGTSNGILNEMFIYYGQNINDDTARLMKEIIPIELNKFHSALTIEEISIGTRLALREQFGEIVYKKVSIKLFNELISRYSTSDMRKRIINAEKQVLNDMTVETTVITQEEKDLFVINSMLNNFEKFCFEGPKSVMFSSIQYDFLIGKGVGLPDWREYRLKASEAFNDKGKNETTISEALSKINMRNIQGEAKRLAIVSLFESLKQSGKTLREYINDFINQKQ